MSDIYYSDHSSGHASSSPEAAWMQPTDTYWPPRPELPEWGYSTSQYASSSHPHPIFHGTSPPASAQHVPFDVPVPSLPPPSTTSSSPSYVAPGSFLPSMMGHSEGPLPGMTPSGSNAGHRSDGYFYPGPSSSSHCEPTAAPPKSSGRLGVKRRQKYTRTRTGCLTCRARRIKCDGARPSCRKCNVAKRECRFPLPEDISRKSKSKDGSTRPSVSNSSSQAASQSGTSPPGVDSYVAPPSTSSSSGSAQASKFDITQAYPEGVDFAGTPLGWDRARSAAAVGTFLEAALIDTMRNRPVPSQTSNTAHSLARETWLNNPIFTTPNFLAPWFPTQQEQSLILHYCANAADLMMAIPTAFNPMLAINLPLALNMPRGADPATDALRISLLATGAVHQAFLLARSNASNTQTNAMFQYASNLRDASKSMVRQASGAASDAALSACTSLASFDILFGGSGWQENFKHAKALVASRGGPSKLLAGSAPTQFSDGMSVTPSRLTLEVLTVYETLGSLTTGREPELLAEKDADWWFSKPNSDPSYPSSHNFEVHSVENQFGISKMAVLLLNRTARLLARLEKFNHGEPLRELSTSHTIAPYNPMVTSVSFPTGMLSFDSTPSSVSSSTASSSCGPTPLSAPMRPGYNRSSSSSSSSAPPCELVQAAKALRNDVILWIDSLTNNPSEIHERVQVGNQAYAHMMKILILTMVFGMSKEAPMIQESAEQVLQHCSYSTAALGMSLDLMWPTIIAGSCFAAGNSRQWVLSLLEGFKSQCCFNVETASTIIHEVWRRSDAGLPRADWKPVCDDFGLQVLLC